MIMKLKHSKILNNVFQFIINIALHHIESLDTATLANKHEEILIAIMI